MTLRLLAVGDIHLGRLPAGLPRELADHGLPPHALGPAAALEGAVEAAIAREVDAVLLLGDVVDGDRHFLPSWSRLEAAARRLEGAGIAIFAVAGNHDVAVLPRLADTVDALHLLGRGGVWERRRFDRGVRGAVDFLGWSYAAQHPACDPFEALDFKTDTARADGVPLLGLLHGDRDAAGSRYARFRRARLLASDATAWLLGHIHAPDFAPAAPGGVASGYLGSLTGLDPTETGPHGPWLLTLDGGALTGVEQLPLAPLRWERLEVDVSGCESPERLQDLLVVALRDFADQHAASFGEARAVGLRVTLTGRHAQSHGLREALAGLRAQDTLIVSRQERIFFVESVRDEIRPAVDLRALARAGDPPGRIARRLLDLSGAAADAAAAARRSELLREARRSLRTVRSQSSFVASAIVESEATGDEDELASRLFQAGLLAIEELLARAPAARGGGGA